MLIAATPAMTILGKICREANSHQLTAKLLHVHPLLVILPTDFLSARTSAAWPYAPGTLPISVNKSFGLSCVTVNRSRLLQES